MTRKELILSTFENRWSDFYGKFVDLGTRHNGSAKILSPFREEAEPSLSIDLAGKYAGRWHDFGSGEDGDLFSFYALLHNLDLRRDFPKILEGICAVFGIVAPSTDGTSKGVKRVRTLAERGISQETAETFQIAEEPGDSAVSHRILFPVKSPDGTSLGMKVHKGPALKADGTRAGKGEAAPVQLYPWSSLKHEEVYILNGEPSVWRAWQDGYIKVVCSTGGEATFKEEWIEDFRGKTVRLILDNDDTGRKGMGTAAGKLHGVAMAVYTVVWPEGWHRGGDAEDWLNKGHTFEDLEFREWVPEIDENAPSGPHSISGASNNEITLLPRSASELMVQAPDVAWQVQDLLPQGAAMVIVADAGVGKTWFIEELALSVDQGTPFLGEFHTRQGKVLVIDEENADALLKRRLQKLLRGAGLQEDGSGLDIEFLTAQGINLSDDNCVAALDKLFDEMHPDLVLIDALVRIHRGNENDAGDMALVFGIIKQWIVTYGCSFVFCHHRRKPGLAGNDSANMFRGSSEIRAFVDTHLDLKPVKTEPGRITVVHSKSRFAEPLAAFDVEIVDVGEDATVVRYVGEAKDQSEDKLEEGQEFILNLLADGERHSRQNILTRGMEAKLGRDTLDQARKALVAAEEVEEEKEGRIKYVRLLKNLPSGPDTYIGRTEGSEENEPDSAQPLLAPEQLLTEHQGDGTTKAVDPGVSLLQGRI